MKSRWLLAMSLVLIATYLLIGRRGEESEPRVEGDSARTAVATFEEDAARPDVVAPTGPPPGSMLTVELVHGIQHHYAAPIPEDGGDRDFAPRVARASGGGAHYDRWLSRAAREIAVQGALLGESPPEPVLSFILRSSGAPEGSVAQMLVRVRGDGRDPVETALENALAAAPTGSGTLLVGVGEAAIENGEFERRLVVVTARRDFELATTTRSLEPGETWEISGRSPEGFSEASASVLYPDHSIVVMPVAQNGRDFSVAIPAGELVGTVRVSIDGTGKEGPGKLVQLEAEVGRPLPTSIEVQMPPAEEFSDIHAAEAYAFERLNLDRIAMGLDTLEFDEALGVVAREHSEEMRDLRYFAHLSPVTGLAVDRLRRVAYPAMTSGENLALNDSIAEAQSSLMESVGHRRNIVNASFTHVGIGLAKDETASGGISWHLTQVFARKVQPLDEEETAIHLLESINAERSERGMETLRVRQDLSELAREGCVQALDAELANVPAAIAPRASRLIGGRVSVSAHAFYELESLDLGQLGGEEDFRQIGLALLRDPESLEGRTFLVVVVAEPS